MKSNLYATIAQLSRIALTGGMFLAAAPLFAQTQPADAENQQNENVNINKPVGVDTDKLTIFRSGDKAEINHYISEVVELKNAAALEVLPNVLEAVRREKGSAQAIQYTNPETGKEQYYIQVVTTAEQMPSVLETIHDLDLRKLTSSSGDIKYHRRMKYRQASEVATVLANTVLSREGAIYADNLTNTVFLRDSQSDGMRDIITLDYYDVPPPQVEFEVLAIEISDNKDAKLGLDWDAWKLSLGGQILIANGAATDLKSNPTTASLLLLDPTVLASFLNYTVETGTAKAITRTKITASNGEPAVVSSLRRLASLGYQTSLYSTPIVFTPKDALAPSSAPVPATRSTLKNNADPNVTSPGASSVDPSLIVGEKAEGVYLAIEPNIGTDMVTANVRVVVNSLTGSTALKEPIITERLMDTQVTLQNEQPFSLGGLDKDTTIKERSGIPLLKEIPVLKYLFSVQHDTLLHSKLFVIITPTFKNQVLFKSPSLNSTTFEVVPPVEVNDAIPPPPPVPEEPVKPRGR